MPFALSYRLIILALFIGYAIFMALVIANRQKLALSHLSQTLLLTGLTLLLLALGYLTLFLLFLGFNS